MTTMYQSAPEAFDGYQLGFGIKSISRGVKSAGRGIKKGAGATARAGKFVAKTAVKVALLPLQLQLKIIQKIMIPVARQVCAMPQPVLVIGATAAGVSVNVVPLFCKAVQLKNMGEIRRLLPTVLKIAVKVAAAGAFPPIVPVLATIRAVPGLQLIPGLRFLAGVEQNEASQIITASELDHFGDAMGYALAGIDDNELAAAMGFSLPKKVGLPLVFGLGAIAMGTGLYIATR